MDEASIENHKQILSKLWEDYKKWLETADPAYFLYKSKRQYLNFDDFMSWLKEGKL